jgi:hypothetical protein
MNRQIFYLGKGHGASNLPKYFHRAGVQYESAHLNRDYLKGYDAGVRSLSKEPVGATPAFRQHFADISSGMSAVNEFLEFWKNDGENPKGVYSRLSSEEKTYVIMMMTSISNLHKTMGEVKKYLEKS